MATAKELREAIALIKANGEDFAAAIQFDDDGNFAGIDEDTLDVFESRGASLVTLSKKTSLSLDARGEFLDSVHAIAEAMLSSMSGDNVGKNGVRRLTLATPSGTLALSLTDSE